MKKIFLMLSFFAFTFLLAGCGGGNEVNNEGIEVDSLEGLYGKTSLSVEDLDLIDKNLFPTSYSYEVYEDGEKIDEGIYVYPEGVDLLLPVYDDVKNRTLNGSDLENGMIYTYIDLELKDGTLGSVVYINDANSLRYLAASFGTDGQTILYEFSY